MRARPTGAQPASHVYGRPSPAALVDTCSRTQRSATEVVSGREQHVSQPLD